NGHDDFTYPVIAVSPQPVITPVPVQPVSRPVNPPPVCTKRPGSGGGWFDCNHVPLPCQPHFSPGSPASTDQTGVWWSEARAHVFRVALCPSDPSTLKPGLVYNGTWGSTNYLANWWVFNADTELGVYSGSGNLFSIADGAASTILLAEAYAECDTIGRVA